MTRIYLVRHGRAAAGWSVDPDPPLDELGAQQAVAVAVRLAPLGPLSILTSPMLRCRQTSAPLAERWRVEPRVEHLVAEIPSPEGVEMVDRVDWLRTAMEGTWGQLGARYTEFRDRAVAFLGGLAQDTVVFSHFVAINAAIGAALGDDRLVLRSLDNCSVTVFDCVSGRLQLVESGHEADTLIR